VELGLADRIGDLRSILRERFGDEVFSPLIAAERGWLGRRLRGVGSRGLTGGPWVATGFAEEIVSALEARALWARYGL
jgi:hypothetical protein